MRRFLKSRLLWTVRVVTESVALLALFFLTIMFCLVVAGCERRDLYIYGNEFHSLTLSDFPDAYQAGRNLNLVMKMNR